MIFVKFREKKTFYINQGSQNQVISKKFKQIQMLVKKNKLKMPFYLVIHIREHNSSQTFWIKKGANIYNLIVASLSKIDKL